MPVRQIEDVQISQPNELATIWNTVDASQQNVVSNLYPAANPTTDRVDDAFKNVTHSAGDSATRIDSSTLPRKKITCLSDAFPVKAPSASGIQADLQTETKSAEVEPASHTSIANVEEYRLRLSNEFQSVLDRLDRGEEVDISIIYRLASSTAALARHQGQQQSNKNLLDLADRIDVSVRNLKEATKGGNGSYWSKAFAATLFIVGGTIGVLSGISPAVSFINSHLMTATAKTMAAFSNGIQMGAQGSSGIGELFQKREDADRLMVSAVKDRFERNYNNSSMKNNNSAGDKTSAVRAIKDGDDALHQAKSQICSPNG